MDERDTQFCEPLVDHKELHVWNHWVGPFERCSRQSDDLFLVVEGNKLNFVLRTLSGFLLVFFNFVSFHESYPRSNKRKCLSCMPLVEAIKTKFTTFSLNH